MAPSYSPEEWGEEKPVDSKMQKLLDSVKAEFEEKSGISTPKLKGLSYRQSKDNPGTFLVKVFLKQYFARFTIAELVNGTAILMDIQEVNTM